VPILGKGAKESELLRGTVGRAIEPTGERISETIAPTESRTEASVNSNAPIAVTKYAINSETITHGTTSGKTIPTGLDGVGIGRIAGRLGA